MSVMVSSGERRALIQGDVLIHPAQITEPFWTPLFDGDAETAEATSARRAFEMAGYGPSDMQFAEFYD